MDIFYSKLLTGNEHRSIHMSEFVICLNFVNQRGRNFHT